jgi:hypothetical protein
MRQAAARWETRNNPMHPTAFSLTRIMLSEAHPERHGQSERRTWDLMDKPCHQKGKNIYSEQSALPAEGLGFDASTRRLAERHTYEAVNVHDH